MSQSGSPFEDGTGPGIATAEPEIHVERIVRHAPLYNVVLLDDDDHTYEYVIEMLMKLFGIVFPKAYQMAEEVDRTGRVICVTTSLERAELKRDQIHAFGKDRWVDRCAGSMTAIIEHVD